ncbi:hypothetical protein K1718_27400 (plasmid) [Roseibium porphyridii]|uniref:Uncharacterized protein n=1 Tax=Roseibium porphyridii TaxID=2866279 RepID=A0ABY8FFL5_9HYPH|nr:hypothetical protein [Roseibium sp. KMA01]WFE92655.1 hypothetical protein K1718_27400 [Roseibium sp. KMA01]
MVEAARAEIQQAIEAAERIQHEGETSDQIDALRAQISVLDGHAAIIQSGSLPQLQLMQTTLPRAVSAVRQSSQAIANDASFQASQHVVEMSIEKLQALQLKHDQQHQAFERYETRSAARIDELATAKGIDISGYQIVRAQIQADIEAAYTRAEKFKGAALLAQNNVTGLILVGGSDEEINEAKTKAAEARARYLKEKEIEALNAGKAEGLSGDALKSYVDQSRSQAAHELDTENVKNAKLAGLTPEQQAQAEAANNIQYAIRKEDLNVRTDDTDFSTSQSVKTNGATDEKLEGFAAQVAEITLKLPVEAADNATDKQPTHVSAATETTPDQSPPR